LAQPINQQMTSAMKLISSLSLLAMIAGLAATVALAGGALTAASLSLSLGMLLLPVAMGDMSPRRRLSLPVVASRAERMALAA
jgi:hypothetical protein